MTHEQVTHITEREKERARELGSARPRERSRAAKSDIGQAFAYEALNSSPRRVPCEAAERVHDGASSQVKDLPLRPRGLCCRCLASICNDAHGTSGRNLTGNAKMTSSWRHAAGNAVGTEPRYAAVYV